MTYNNHSLRVLFAVCVRVHCAVLEEQPRCPSVSMLGWVAGWSRRVTAVIASRKRPVPFRTRKLSSIAPMVLHSGGCGRVGRRRTSFIGSGGVLEPRQGVRLHHSLLSCPKPDAPVRDRAPSRWSEGDEEGPAGARSVMAGSASCPRRFPRARRGRVRDDAERPRRPMHAVPTDRRRSRQPRVDPPRGPDPAGPGRRRGRRRF